MCVCVFVSVCMYGCVLCVCMCVCGCGCVDVCVYACMCGCVCGCDLKCVIWNVYVHVCCVYVYMLFSLCVWGIELDRMFVYF